MCIEVGVSLLFVRTAVTVGSVQGTVLRTHTLNYAFSAPKTVITQAGNVIQQPALITVELLLQDL